MSNISYPKKRVKNNIKKVKDWSGIKSVMFDLDGLIADTEDLHLRAYHEVAKYLGIVLTDEYMHSFIGLSTAENVKKIIKDFKIENYSFDDIVRLRYENYYKIISHTPLFPMEGALECMERVKQKGLKKGLVTSSLREHAIGVLKNIQKYTNGAFDPLKFFDFMLFGDDIEHSKPQPDIYIKASKVADTPPSKCLALEDSEAGVISAKRAGFLVIAIPNYHTKNQNFDLADMVLLSLKEVALLDFLQ